MSELCWIDAAITSARPQAMAALLRYFGNLDAAEEAFQEACLRALRSWPEKGPPRDPAAWLIFVGRNFGVDQIRKTSRQTALPDESRLSNLDDRESEMAERLDNSHYHDDVLRLLFICCHPDLPATQQIALALRIVSGLTVKEIARAFLVSEAAMEQRITRAKRIVNSAGREFETPNAVDRAERLGVVAAMLYLLFNEGYSATGGAAHVRASLCTEAMRLTRLLLRLFPAEPEIMGLLALMLFQHARTPARLDSEGQIILLEDQDRGLWDRSLINEGLVLIDKAIRHARPGGYQVQAALAAAHARAAKAEDTNWNEIDRLYGLLEHIQPSPVVTLNRSVAASKVHGPQAALDMLEPLEKSLGGYFYFHGVKGAYLLQLGRTEDARTSFNRAVTLANAPAEAAHIRQHIDRLQQQFTSAKKPLELPVAGSPRIAS